MDLSSGQSGSPLEYHWIDTAMDTIFTMSISSMISTACNAFLDYYKEMITFLLVFNTKYVSQIFLPLFTEFLVMDPVQKSLIQIKGDSFENKKF